MGLVTTNVFNSKYLVLHYYFILVAYNYTGSERNSQSMSRNDGIHSNATVRENPLYDQLEGKLKLKLVLNYYSLQLDVEKMCVVSMYIYDSY